MRRSGDAIAAAARRRAASRRRGAASVRSAITLALAAALGACGAVVVEWAVSPDRNRQSSTVAELLDGRRVANGRLTGGAPFAEYAGPVRQRMRGGVAKEADDGETPLAERRRVRAAEVLADGVERPTKASLQAVGVLRLSEGRYRLASATLERAREASPQDARVTADLAVALLEEAIAEDVPRLAARALAVSDEAIALDPLVDEAWFTRAAALEHLWIGPAAVQAWYDYLGRDEASLWAVEARRRVCALERLADPSTRVEARRRFETAIAEGDAELAEAVGREYPSEARRVATDRLVKDWPAAALGGRAADAQRILNELRVAADALAAVQQDRFLFDALSAIDSSPTDPDRRRLADALATYGGGREAFRRGEVQVATASFADASRRLSSASCDSVASLAEFDRARCEIYSREYGSVVRRLEGLRPEAERRGYRHLVARSWWVSGYVHAVRFDVAQALGQLRRALDGLDATGDVEGSAIVGLLLAETSHWYGLGDEAWEHSRRALAALSRMGNTGQASVGFGGVAIIAAADCEPATSGCLLDAALSAAAGAGDDSSAAAALGLRALNRARQSNLPASAADLAAAREAFARVADPVMAERVGAEVELVEAELNASASPEQSVELLTRVLATYDGTSDRVRTVQCLRLRAAANAALGDSEAARRDFTAAVDELAEQRRRLLRVERRAMLGSETRAVFALGIVLHFGLLNDSDGAFRLSDRERTWDRNGTEADEPPTVAEVVSTVRERETVLAYTTRADALCVWVIDRNGAVIERKDIAMSRLREDIERFRRGVKHGEASELGQLSEPIVEALWRPVEARIPEDTTVVIIGDEFIRSLPFGALVDSRTGRFLIERNAFAMARSVVDIVGRSASTVASDGPVLVVGDPEFDETRHPGLARLPRAAAEARAVAAIYGRARLFIGGDATVSAFRGEAGRSAIIHYAGHAVDDVDDRRDSALLVSDGAIVASDVARLRLAHVKLAVLAACGTSAVSAGLDASPGSESLADAFLDAGVGEVVASHWAVSDDATAEMLVEFHRRLRAGESAALALRGAVLSVIGGPDGGGLPPRDWAAIGVFC